MNTISLGHVNSSFQYTDRNYKANSIGQYFMVVMLVLTETHAERENERENAKKIHNSVTQTKKSRIYVSKTTIKLSISYSSFSNDVFKRSI